MRASSAGVNAGRRVTGAAAGEFCVEGVLARSVSGVILLRCWGGAGEAGGDGGRVGESGRGILFKSWKADGRIPD